MTIFCKNLGGTMALFACPRLCLCIGVWVERYAARSIEAE